MSGLKTELSASPPSDVKSEDAIDKIGQLIESSLDNVAGGFDDFHLVNSHMATVQIDLDGD